MRASLLLCLVLSVVCASEVLHCSLAGYGGLEISGDIIIIKEGKDSVNVRFKNVSVPRGEYAITIHEFGDLTRIDESLQAGFGNVFQGDGTTNYGCYPNADRHAGELGNVTFPEQIIIEGLDLIKLVGSNSVAGRGLVIWNNATDCATDGAYKTPLATCVLGVQNEITNVAQNNDITLSMATVSLKGTSNCPECNGTVWINQVENGIGDQIITVVARVNGLEDGAHGIHIHQFGDMSLPDATSAGPHWNPANKVHKLPKKNDRHQGDLGNIEQTYKGQLWYQYNATRDEVFSLTSIIGRAIVMHRDVDHGDGYECDQAGNAGPRMLIGVIGVTNQNTEPDVPEELVFAYEWEAIDCKDRNSLTAGWIAFIVLGMVFAVFLVFFIFVVLKQRKKTYNSV